MEMPSLRLGAALAWCEGCEGWEEYFVTPEDLEATSFLGLGDVEGQKMKLFKHRNTEELLAQPPIGARWWPRVWWDGTETVE